MTNTFGLDISTSSIRVARLTKAGSGFSLDAVGMVPIDAKNIQSESMSDQQFIADAIKKLMSDAQIKTNVVNLSLPENMVYSKIIEMPDLSDQELAAALRWEMEQYVPLPIDQVQTDYQILSKKTVEDKKLMDVLLVAAPLSVIQKYENILTLANLEPEGIESEMISVHRAVTPFLAPDGPSMIVHLGPTTSDIVIVNNGVMQMVFNIGIGGIAMTRAISQDLGIDLAQAEEYKRAYGLNNDALDGKVGHALVPILQSVSADVKKAMFSYREKGQDSEIKQIVLSGNEALLPGVDVYFTNTLNAQVVIGSAWRGYNVTNVPDQLLAEAPSFNTVTGLSLRDLL